MRILFVSGELTGSALCQKLIAEGNEVKLYIHKPEWVDCYDGIATKVSDWHKELPWVSDSGIIVFDDVIFGREQDELRRAGYTVVGGSEGGDLLETNREYFQDILSGLNIPTLQSKNFDTPNEAINFIRHNPKRWVVKQNSHMSSLNFIGIALDGSDAIRVLKRYEKRKIAGVHLQEYVNGIEVGVARYFNGIDWVGPIEINHEHKHLHEGDRGPLTPEMGTILWYTDKEIPLFTKTLDKLKQHLRKIDFRGDIDINFMVNEEGIWPLEATPRFGCPSTEIQIELHNSPWTDFLRSVGGREGQGLNYSDGYGIAISLVVPPFPYDPSESSEKTKNLRNSKIHFSEDLTEEEMIHIHFEEVSRSQNSYFWAGKSGILMHVTAQGKTIAEAREKAYQIVKKIHFKGVYYRKDIGIRVMNHDIPMLQKWGWL